jgi:hypothetical protein
LLLNFLYDHIAKSGDHQARIKWEPMSMVLWVCSLVSSRSLVLILTRMSSIQDNRVTGQCFFRETHVLDIDAFTNSALCYLGLLAPQSPPSWGAYHAAGGATHSCTFESEAG